VNRWSKIAIFISHLYLLLSLKAEYLNSVWFSQNRNYQTVNKFWGYVRSLWHECDIYVQTTYNEVVFSDSPDVSWWWRLGAQRSTDQCFTDGTV